MATRIGILGFDRPADTASALLRACGGWPTHPVVDVLTPESADDWIQSARGDELLALVRCSDSGRQASTLMLFDALRRELVPTVVVIDEPAGFAHSFADDGFDVVGPRASMESLAHRLEALAHRQGLIQRLAGDIRSADRCHARLWDQMGRIEDELQLAAMVQRAFLPTRMPEVGDARFGVFFRPASYVSGDIYDIRRLDERTVGFFLADAVGHGVPAALMTMMIARSLTVKEIVGSEYRILPPGEVLGRLNADLLARGGLDGRFATAVYGTIDVLDGEVTMAVAGHPAPLCIDAAGECEPITLDNGLLGVFPDEVYEEVHRRLEPGERLLIYSDGFERLLPDGDETDVRRGSHRFYARHFGRWCSMPRTAQETIEDVERLIGQQAGSLHQDDDLTIICVEMAATAASAGDLTATCRAA